MMDLFYNSHLVITNTNFELLPETSSHCFISGQHNSIDRNVGKERSIDLNGIRYVLIFIDIRFLWLNIFRNENDDSMHDKKNKEEKLRCYVYDCFIVFLKVMACHISILWSSWSSSGVVFVSICDGTELQGSLISHGN